MLTSDLSLPLTQKLSARRFAVGLLTGTAGFIGVATDGAAQQRTSADGATLVAGINTPTDQSRANKVGPIRSPLRTSVR